MFSKYGSISCIHALSSILKFRGGRVDGRVGGRVDGRVRENNATSGPNSSAEAEMDWVELVSWGRVWQLGQNKHKNLGNIENKSW